MKKLLIVYALMLAASTTPPARAQADANPFATTESFAAAIRNKIFECNAINFPRVRFVDSRLEILAGNAISATLESLEYVEPGVAKVTYTDNTSDWFVFSDDLKSFVMVYASGTNDFRIPSGEVIRSFPPSSAAGGAGTIIEMVGHQYWKDVRLLRTKMEILNPGTAEAFASNDMAVAQPGALTVVLPSGQHGCLAFSRTAPGGRWIYGPNMFFGMRLSAPVNFVVGRDKFEEDEARSLLFLEVLAREKRWDVFAALELQLQAIVQAKYGETSAQLGDLYLRLAGARDRAGFKPESEKFRLKATEHAQKNFPDDGMRQSLPSIALVMQLMKDGKIEEARTELTKMEGMISKQEADSPIIYLFLRFQGECAFGLRDYAQATSHFEKALASGALKDPKETSRDTCEALKLLISSHVALGKLKEASDACTKRAELATRMQQSSLILYPETREQALAWAAIGRWDDAIAAMANPKLQKRPENTALECLLLWNAGKKDEARKLAMSLQPVTGPVGADAMYFALASAIADISPTKTKAKEAQELWTKHLEELKKGPAANYLHARFSQITLKSL